MSTTPGNHAADHFRGRLHVAGSAKPDCDPDLLAHAHQTVHAMVRTALSNGASVVVTAVKEPRQQHGGSNLPLVFDWTILEAASTALDAGQAQPTTVHGALVIAVASDRARAATPSDRQALWDRLSAADAVDLHQLPPGWGAGGELRTQTARHGDTLITLGGGEGVEHLAWLYQRRQRPVIPLDYPLGSATATAARGGEGLARQALSEPGRFLSLSDGRSAAARLASLSHRRHPDPEELAAGIVELLDRLTPPPAFYVRMLDPAQADFPAVDEQFRQVIDPVVTGLGYQSVQIDSVPSRSPFINVDIFDRLTAASVVVVDLTGLRPNCFLELGYALGAGLPTIITAADGTHLPFDTQAMPCLFWRPDDPVDQRRTALGQFWRTHVARRPLNS